MASRVAHMVYGRLGEALTAPDSEHQMALATFVGVLADPLEPLYHLVESGWAGVTDPTVCPDVWLCWLAQAAGVVLPEGVSADTARLMVAHPVGWLAGTPQALITAVQGTLSGSRRVDLVEHVDDDPWQVRAIVYAAETADGQATQRAADQAVEAGIQVTVVVRPGWSFADIAQSGLSFAEIARLTGRQVKAIVPGTPKKMIEELMTP